MPSTTFASARWGRLLVAASLLLPTFARASSADWTTDFEEAKATAASSDRDLLLLFTGSDWCPPCMALEEEVLDKAEFAPTADAAFVPVLLDFPSEKPQPDAVKAQNFELQSTYKIQGYPTMVLADATGRAYAQTGFDPRVAAGGPSAYAEHLVAMRAVRDERDAAFAAAAEATGVERARELDRGLKAMDPDFVGAFYTEEVLEIVALDADGSAGLKPAYQKVLRQREMENGLTAAVERMQQGDLQGGIDQVNELKQTLSPEGEMLQTLEVVLGQAHGLLGQDKLSAEAFSRAIEAYPQGQMVPQIRALLEQ